MTDEPLPGDATGEPIDPLADTQPTEVWRFAPTPDPRPDAQWAWAPPGSAPAAAGWGTGTPAATPAYGSAAWGASMPGGGSNASLPWTPAGTAAPRRGGAGLGTILVVSLLSAGLASGGTVLVLDRNGAFNRPAPVSNSTVGTPVSNGGSVTTDESSAVISVAAKLSPAVVKITVDGQTGDPFGNGTSPTEGIGSGVIYDANGWILTNRHVVTGSTKLTVELKDGRTFDGTVYGVDSLTDLAIVKVDGTGLPTAPIGISDTLKIGQLVIAIGSPLGTYSFSVTSGIVSGKQRDLQVSNGSSGASRITNLIQTDAAINPGNSGGPLADASGNVIGINTASAADGSGIGFAIPIDIARPIMNQALRGQALSRPWIGIRFESIDLQLQTDLKLPVSAGALVTTSAAGDAPVVADGPADKAGVKESDIITALNGIAIDTEHPLDALLTQFAPGETIHMTILRDGKTQTLDVVLGTRPANL
jgi:serine protease Do